LPAFNNLAMSASEGPFRLHRILRRPFAFYTPLGPIQIPEPLKQFLNCLFAWVHIAHRGLNVIASSYVLQRERILVLPGLGQKVPVSLSGGSCL
jgi:hypothetical protein